jgi:hypothetical protein
MEKIISVAFVLLLLFSFGCTRVATTVEESSFCEGNDNDTEKDLCYFDVAKQTNDSTLCVDIADSALSEKCKAEVKEAPKQEPASQASVPAEKESATGH